MSIITDDNNFNLITNVCKKYFNELKFGDVGNVNVLFSTDIYSDANKYLWMPPLDNIPNGCMLRTSKNIILINYDIYKNDKTTLPITIFHELTHWVDYNKFIKEYCNNRWGDIINHQLYNNFYLWSEYHARLLSLYYGRCAMMFFDKSYLIEDIIGEFQSNERIEIYKNTIKNKYNLSMYDIFTYCAQLYLCEFFNAKICIENYIPNNIHEYFPSFKSLYYKLKNIQTYEKASLNFESLI